MRFWIIVFPSLLILAACARHPMAQARSRPNQGQPPQAGPSSFYRRADFYQIRFTDASQERIRVVYIQVSQLYERHMPCNQATRTCRDFIRQELTLFVVPVTDIHLRQGMGTDICPHLEIHRNGTAMRSFTERAHESFCAYRTYQPLGWSIPVGQHIGQW